MNTNTAVARSTQRHLLWTAVHSWSLFLRDPSHYPLQYSTRLADLDFVSVFDDFRCCRVWCLPTRSTSITLSHAAQDYSTATAHITARLSAGDYLCLLASREKASGSMLEQFRRAPLQGNRYCHLLICCADVNLLSYQPRSAADFCCSALLHHFGAIKRRAACTVYHSITVFIVTILNPRTQASDLESALKEYI